MLETTIAENTGENHNMLYPCSISAQKKSLLVILCSKIKERGKKKECDLSNNAHILRRLQLFFKITLTTKKAAE